MSLGNYVLTDSTQSHTTHTHTIHKMFNIPELLPYDLQQTSASVPIHIRNAAVQQL